ncbi:Spc7-domain-containing protein [Amniculicola lignicola CBS 123094]|uniref:Spc7-domain-containing protein n=1 Tax=Amniculicola lignicola CBS 123094 TaxID=1392246 RepID=A0A6A5W6X0_9PLEO|nr:Spc7-domain-containing protein [Amniculicola lignicola CBS 123094]
MAGNAGKENIADGLIASAPLKAAALSPKKSSRKTRSKSIGPGGLGLEEPALKESTGNRRKSAFIPAVKSILASNDEDEKKRRDARRKSLARRRVSFAPEATLHTWDVVEYLRDATTSSASSDATRRASSVSQASAQGPSTPNSDVGEPPSTPPEQIEEPEVQVGSSPANQRDLHQKKRRRRSSGIPPMNFNNPDDIYSSSPLSGDNASPGGNNDDSESDSGDPRVDDENSPNVNESEDSSIRLDNALRQAASNTQKLELELDEGQNSDMSMELAEGEVTVSLAPWTKNLAGTPAHLRTASPLRDQDPFAFEASMEPPGDDTQDMSMDITRAVGRIMPQEQPESPDFDDATMDLTMPLGGIQQAASKELASRRKSLKRRRSSVLDVSQGSPAKRTTNRRTSLRPKATHEQAPSDDDMMDFTVAIGSIVNKSETVESNRRNSVESVLDDETMDFTIAVGSIKDTAIEPAAATQALDSEEDEDLSMEFTNVIGGIKRTHNLMETPMKSPVKVKNPTPQKSPRKSPGRPRRSLVLTTPEVPPSQPPIEFFEPSPFVRSTAQGLQMAANTITTPTSESRSVLPREIPEDPIAAPILNRRRSSLSAVQFSPLAVVREEPTLKSTALLTSNIKLLSTPRKQTLQSPVKRGLTPKKSQTPQKEAMPRQKTPTPKKATPRKSLSPRKRVIFGEDPIVDEEEADANMDEPEDEVERISLQDFLEMTRIRFMDISTTKRRHTAAPAAFRDVDVEETEDSLDRYVVAAACTVPEHDLYSHACHEMKKFISEGRHFVRTMESNVMEENPMLFSEYLTAPPDQRTIMDSQFKNLKTRARLEARGEWYTWRSSLLHDLKGGLISTMDGFNKDEKILKGQETLLDAVLPPLEQQHQQLESKRKQLQQRHDELNSCDREELEQAREQLVAADTEIEEKRRLIAQLEEELSNKEARIEAAKERKTECAEEIKAAERVREECRGWSTSEVKELKTKVTALEREHGWSIISATSTTLTMTHLNDLELYFQPSAFSTGSNTPNASISLSYIGDSATPHPRPLTTSKRFFLQLIRAHLHCIPQSQMRVADLLSLVKNVWATALSVAEGVRWLQHSYITDEFILSDERMAISANLLLPAVQTKVRATFEIGVGLGKKEAETQVDISAELVYGEKYSEEKMAAFLRDFCGKGVRGEQDMGVWGDACGDLLARLRATGRKGERA